MSTPGHHTPLIDRLPKVRGKLREGAELAKVTWFQVGGPADVMFRPADEADLSAFLKGKPDDMPVTVIGVGSNLLVRDGGIRGVVIRLGRPFTDAVSKDGDLHVGAGALDLNVAQVAQQAGISGSGIPVRYSRHHWRGPSHECRRLWHRDQGCADLGHSRRW